MAKNDEGQWELVAERTLSLIGTQLTIVYTGSLFPYHVHRLDACFGAAMRLEDAKELCRRTASDLLEMGMDP